MEFSPSENLADQVARYLMDRIIRGEIEAGERLIELAIAEDLGVSQAPVREALRILEKYRFVRQVPRKGTTVTELTPEFIESIYDIFIELVALATAKTALRRNDDDLEAIRRALDEAADCVRKDDLFAFNSAFFAWGLTCLKAAHDPLLEEMLMDLVPSMGRIQYRSLRERRDDIEWGLEMITRSTELIEAGDPEGASHNNRKGLLKEKSKILKR